MRRARPSVLVLTGALLDGHNLGLVREQLWDGVSVVGLTDVADDALEARLRMAGYADLFAKPVAVEEVADAVQRRLERRALAELTGLVGESEANNIPRICSARSSGNRVSAASCLTAKFQLA
jgi:DNA-binding response OmpR family regulator